MFSLGVINMDSVLYQQVPSEQNTWESQQFNWVNKGITRMFYEYLYIDDCENGE